VVSYVPVGQATLSGQVLFSGRRPAPDPSLAEPLSVVLRVAGQARAVYTATVTADTAGRFALPNLAPGTYDLYVRGQHSLWTVLHNVTLPDTGGTVTIGPLREGDVDRDGLVSQADFALLVASYGKVRGEAGFAPGADLNEDGVVNIYDFSLLAANYGYQAEEQP
jgi:hypothetical protein